MLGKNPNPSHPVGTGGVVDTEVGVASLVLGEEAVIPHGLEVLEDGSPELGLVRGAEVLPDIVHTDGGRGVLDELRDCLPDLGCPLCDEGLVLPAGDLAVGLLRDDELALLIHAQEACGGEVVDLDAGEACGVLVGGFEGRGDDVRHGWITFRLGLGVGVPDVVILPGAELGCTARSPAGIVPWRLRGPSPSTSISYPISGSVARLGARPPKRAPCKWVEGPGRIPLGAPLGRYLQRCKRAGGRARGVPWAPASPPGRPCRVGPPLVLLHYS